MKTLLIRRELKNCLRLGQWQIRIKYHSLNYL